MSEALATKPTKLSDVKEIEWAKLLDEALTLPPRMSDTYTRLYNYSFLNQLLLRMQGVNEVPATYARWQEVGRQVKKGSKAKSILRPLFVTVTNEDGDDERRVKGFKLVRCIFGYSDTEGEELPPLEPKGWDRDTALGGLAIREVSYELLDPNTQGYSTSKEFAINPIAKYPLKTTFHELGHIVLGHTTPDELAEYSKHRGLREFQAESVAYLAMHELELDDQMDAPESRAYIQHWLSGETPDDQSIKQVFAATSKILQAGRGEL